VQIHPKRDSVFVAVVVEVAVIVAAAAVSVAAEEAAVDAAVALYLGQQHSSHGQDHFVETRSRRTLPESQIS